MDGVVVDIVASLFSDDDVGSASVGGLDNNIVELPATAQSVGFLAVIVLGLVASVALGAVGRIAGLERREKVFSLLEFSARKLHGMLEALPWRRSGAQTLGKEKQIENGNDDQFTCHGSAVCWQSPPQDNMEEILQKMGLIARTRLVNVCMSWSSLVKRADIRSAHHLPCPNISECIVAAVIGPTEGIGIVQTWRQNLDSF
ncbi:hypothetical protein ACLB2K_011988 [Fragaria x ananassa]